MERQSKIDISGVNERTIDFVLARRALLRAFGRGEVLKTEICDAQPELMRAALNLGKPKSSICPICRDTKLVSVYFAFGPKLPAHGRCLNSESEIDSILSRHIDAKVYEVEVCLNCKWNHLDRLLAPFVFGEESA
ncbi:DUF5318 family protein [Acidithrix sp. C25]|uniref:DUF5318 family protein n=1 Tax=Acidithrix sp. C25 TaxID=1671482 RepID=UPI00191B98AF|nr:DUF5318 family protein [Acidithrix sp. C25]